jgi:hypothetical protein
MRRPTRPRPDARDTSNSVGPRSSSRRRRARHPRSFRRTNRRELLAMANSEAGRYERRRRRPPVRRSLGRVVSALFFFPRGGSAQVARALPAAGWQLTLAAGSLGQWGDPTDAASFFAGVDVHPLDYMPALELAQPLGAPVPFPPSYEDRPAAPDRVFADVDDAAYERLVAAWIDVLARAGCGGSRPAPSAPPDARERGRSTPLRAGARAGPAARDRARDAAHDRGRSAAGLALRRGLGPAAASLGATLRTARRAARGGGGSGPPARPRAGEAVRPPERRRARALLAATTRGGRAACVLAPLAR